MSGGRATAGGSHVHCAIDQSGRRPALLRQHRHAYAAGLQHGLLTANLIRLRSWTPTDDQGPRTAHRPISTRFEPAPPLRSFNHWFTCVTPSDLARRTRAVWYARHVPPLSGPLATLPGVPRVGLPSASIGPLRRPNGEGLPPPLDYVAPRGALSSGSKWPGASGATWPDHHPDSKVQAPPRRGLSCWCGGARVGRVGEGLA